MTSDLPMGRWREMSQGEVDILSEEVGLKPVALPGMKAKTKDKLDRMQRKVAKPIGRGERRPRVLRSAHEADAPSGGGKGRRSRDDQPARKPRDADERSKPGRGTPVAERPSAVGRDRKPSPTKRNGPPASDGQRPGFGRGDRSKRP